MAIPELTERIHQASGGLDRQMFLELLRWRRATAGLPELD